MVRLSAPHSLAVNNNMIGGITMKLAIAFLMFTVALLVPGAAHADDGIDQTICNQLALGQSPGEVAGELHDGNATITRQRAVQRVWEALPECPND
jgi:hypothetical protein